MSYPAGWETRRLKFVATCNDETLHEGTDPDFEIAYVDISSVDLINGITAMEMLTFEEAPSRARRIVKDGDTLISTVRTYLKAIASVKEPPENMIVSTGFAVVRPLALIDSGFLGYALQNTVFIDAVVANSTGVSYPAINPTALICLRVAYPTDKEEQRQIAAFLDWKTGQIDALIAKKKELMEKLKEKRLAVITQAVTKGLIPDAPMRDSNVNWLQSVPAHWHVRRLKFNVSKVGSGVTPKGGAEGYEDSGIPLLRSQNIHFNGLRLDDVVFISEDTHSDMATSQVASGDVLLNITGASIGRCHFATEDLGEANVNQHVCIVRPASELLTKYLYFALCSDIGQLQIDLEQGGSGREGLNFVAIKNFILPLPGILEQQEIVMRLEVVVEKLKDLSFKVESAIARLTEYRTALITAATTGKIDVRHVAVPAPT